MLGSVPHADTNICDISPPVFRQLYMLLDLDDIWMKVIEVIPPNHMTFPDTKINELAHEIYGPMRSPARALLRCMGGGGLCVRHLIGYFHRLKLERELELICRPVPIKITVDPKASQFVVEGDRIELECQAVGFPYPIYQWFKGKEEVPDGDKEVLVINNVRCADAGVYCCHVHNKLKLRDEVKFSSKCRVMVEPNHFSATGPRRIHVNLSHQVVLNSPRPHQEGMKYQWQKDGSIIHGAVEPTLKIHKATFADTGNYKCLINYCDGRETATDIVLDVVSRASVDSQVIEPDLPVIWRQPKSCAVEPGGEALFRLEATGSHLQYQWFRDLEVMPGECRKELYVSPERSQDSCQYTCIVSNQFGQVESMPATLLVKQEIGCKYNAKDKLALLIGNGEYRLHRPLPGTRSDIRDLGQKLNQMGFKVITLVNLTKDEMLNSIDAFCSLLARDVYCLFYFAGHGFKSKDRGRHYLAPVEANVTLSIPECICAEVIRQKMQDKNPALNVMFLDICRVLNRDSKAEDDVELKPVSRNTFIGYATSEGNKAYDDTVKQEGLFAKHLKKVLMQPKDLREMFADLQYEVHHDPLASGHNQIPDAITTMAERRSLMDEIEYTGYTKEYNQRAHVWESDYHAVPEARKLSIRELDLVVQVEFEKEFSNVLSVIMRVKAVGDSVIRCTPSISKDQLPKTLSIRQGTSREYVTRACISDLQKLRQPLTLLILIDIKMADRSSSLGHVTLDLGLPLVSKLDLYMEHKDALDLYGGACGTSVQNKPVEQDWTCTSSAELHN